MFIFKTNIASVPFVHILTFHLCFRFTELKYFILSKEGVYTDMQYEWIDEFLLNKKGVTKDLQKDWNWIRYLIGGKMFAAICLDKNNEPYYITLKLDPMEGELLRNEYDDIIPGYYMNKTHWNSVKYNGSVSDNLLKDMLTKSYKLVLSGFSKKKQTELLA